MSASVGYSMGMAWVRLWCVLGTAMAEIKFSEKLRGTGAILSKILKKEKEKMYIRICPNLITFALISSKQRGAFDHHPRLRLRSRDRLRPSSSTSTSTQRSPSSSTSTHGIGLDLL
ncbi:hypothetical protein ACSBR2_040855 [Camellia fascicularis]